LSDSYRVGVSGKFSAAPAPCLGFPNNVARVLAERHDAHSLTEPQSSLYLSVEYQVGAGVGLEDGRDRAPSAKGWLPGFEAFLQKAAGFDVPAAMVISIEESAFQARWRFHCLPISM
jgi:hypothetical protein